MRAFIAVAVPELVLKSCQDIVAQLKGLNLQGRFAKTRSMHLTLHFLGNIEEEQIPGIAEILEQAGKGVTPFDLEVRQLGVFPQLTNPRVVWIRVEPIDALLTLQSKIQQGLEPLGFPKENRDFHPHLTLLRLKSRKNLRRLAQYIETEGPGLRVGVIKAEQIHLYQSILKPQGAEYRKLFTARLGN